MEHDMTVNTASCLDATPEGLLEFINESPSMFHAAAAICARLDAAGFTYLPEGMAWDIEPGGSYYTRRNGSSVVAWRVGTSVPDPQAADVLAAPYHFQLTASHSDSPAFKVKSAAELEGPEGALRLATEAYGGMMDYTWFDRPLSLAGRVLVREGVRIESRLVALNRDVALIPSVAIHMARDVNKSFGPNRACDLFPLVSVGDLTAGSLDTLLADALEVEPGQIVSRDLFLVNRAPGSVWGATDEFVSSPRLDDLMCAYTSLVAFAGVPAAAVDGTRINVYACFDNEEVGSETKQGAASTLLADGLNRPQLNRGLVVKEAANQHYCTDAFSRAVLEAILDDAEVPYQAFANRSDMAGGSTLGNISNTQVSVHAVDVGCAQLAMHSCVETAGARDVALAVDALAAFYAANIQIDDADAADL